MTRSKVGDRTVTVRVPRRGTLSGRWSPKGETVDLFFGYSETPYATVRLWDDSGQEPGAIWSLADVRRVVTEWVTQMDRDPAWPTWYEDILAATEQ